MNSSSSEEAQLSSAERRWNRFLHARQKRTRVLFFTGAMDAHSEEAFAAVQGVGAHEALTRGRDAVTAAAKPPPEGESKLLLSPSNYGLAYRAPEHSDISEGRSLKNTKSGVRAMRGTTNCG